MNRQETLSLLNLYNTVLGVGNWWKKNLLDLASTLISQLIVKNQVKQVMQHE